MQIYIAPPTSSDITIQTHTHPPPPMYTLITIPLFSTPYIHTSISEHGQHQDHNQENCLKTRKTEYFIVI